MDRHAIQRRVAEFQRAYMTEPDFLDRHYQLPSITKLLMDSSVLGVSRFIELPSFEPERLFTFVYRASSIEISAAIGATSLWCSMPSVCQVPETGEWEVEEGEPFQPSQASHRSAVLALPSMVCPLLLQDWATVRMASSKAGKCSTDACDGIGYNHRVADREIQTNSDWHNPKVPDHAPQIALVKAYAKLLHDVGLYSK